MNRENELLNILKEFNISLDDDPKNFINDIEKLKRYEEILMMYLKDNDVEFSKDLIDEKGKKYSKDIGNSSKHLFYLLCDIDITKKYRIIDFFTKKVSINYNKTVNGYFKITEKIKAYPTNYNHNGEIMVFIIFIKN